MYGFDAITSLIIGVAIIVALYIGLRLVLRHYFPSDTWHAKRPRPDSGKPAGAPASCRLHGRSLFANARASLRRWGNGVRACFRP